MSDREQVRASAREQIREFLATRRARLTPEQAGLPVFGGGRRVKGLRREEVATLAGISVEYYIRLERGDATGVSESVLDGINHTLQLDEAERAHLRDLLNAGVARRRASPAAQPVLRAPVQRILDSMATTRSGRVHRSPRRHRHQRPRPGALRADVRRARRSHAPFRRRMGEASRPRDHSREPRERHADRPVAADQRVRPGRPAGRERGWFVEPTVFADVDNADRLAREEVFGPVLAIIPYDDEADAVRIADDSEYGLAGSVWTADEARGVDVARRVRTGTIGVNYYAIDFDAPFGGLKASGIGREYGPEGLSSYLDHKSIYTSAAQLPS